MNDLEQKIQKARALGIPEDKINEYLKKRGLIKDNGGFVSGFKKGAINQLKGLVSLSGKASDKVKELMWGTINPNVNWERIIKEENQQNPLRKWGDNRLKTSQNEKAGEFTAEVLGFMIPGTSITKGASAINKLQDAGKIGKISANLYKRLLTGGGEGLITAAQSGDPEKGYTSAFIGAILPAGGKISRYFDESKTKQATDKLWKAIRPTGKLKKSDIDKVRNAIKTVAAYTTRAGRKLPESLEELLNETNRIKREVMAAMDKLLKDNNVEIEAKEVFKKPIDYLQKNAKSLYITHRDELMRVASEIEDLINTKKTFTLSDLEKAKQRLNDALVADYRAGKTKLSNLDRTIKHQLVKSIREIIDKKISEVAKEGIYKDLNKVYGYMSQIEPYITNRLKVDLNKANVGLYDAFAGTSGIDDLTYGAVNLMTGNPGGIGGILSGLAQSTIGRVFTKANEPDRMIEKNMKKLSEEYKKYLKGTKDSENKLKYSIPLLRSLLQNTITD